MSRLYEYMISDEFVALTSDWARNIAEQGFDYLYLSNFIHKRHHNWCHLHLFHYAWTGQMVWFETIEDKAAFALRFMTPAMSLAPNERYGVKVPAESPERDEVVEQIVSLGGQIGDPPVWYGQGLHLIGEKPDKTLWLVTDERGALAGKMLDLEFFDARFVRGPSDAELDAMDLVVTERMMHDRFEKKYLYRPKSKRR